MFSVFYQLQLTLYIIAMNSVSALRLSSTRVLGEATGREHGEGTDEGGHHITRITESQDFKSQDEKDNDSAFKTRFTGN